MIERNPEARCENCPYWFELDAGALPAGLDSAVRVGECRESKPRLYPVPTQRIAAQSNILLGAKDGMPQIEHGITFQPFNPRVTADFVCGDHPELILSDEEEAAE